MTATLLCGRWFDFARASVAYTQDDDAAVEVAADVPVTRAMPLVRRSVAKIQRYSSSGADYVANDLGAANFIPKGTDGIYLYGGLVGGAGYLWRTSDLVTWSKCNATHIVSYLYVTKSGTLIGINGGVVSYSTDQGVTWTNSTTQPSWTTTGVWPLQDHGWSEDASGAIMMGEYKAPTGGTKVFRTTDEGVHWSTVLDASAYSPNHCHTVCWHSQTNTWFAVFGDGANQRWWKSTDSGDSWNSWGTNGRNRQPVALRDFQDPKYLLLGADTDCSSGGIIDITAASLEVAEIREARVDWAYGTGLKQNAWTIEYYGGVLWLFQRASTPPAVNMREISISSDKDHWTTIASTETASVGFEYSAGQFLGKLHLNHNNAEHYMVDVTGLVADTGVLLSPGHTNMCIEALSVASSVDVFYSGSGQTKELSTPYVGAYSLKAYRAGGDGTNTVMYCGYGGGAAVALTSGTLYSGSVRLRGFDDDESAQFSQVWFGRSTGAEGPKGTCRLNEYDWAKVTIQHTPGTSANFWLLVFALRTINGTNAILHDAIQINEGDPQPWQIGGTPLAATVVSASIAGNVGHEIILQPFVASYRQSSTPLKYIWSYVKDASNYLRVYYDPADKVFGFQRTVGGVDQAAVESAAVEFGDHSEIRLTVSMTASATSMTVKVGTVSETISEAAGLSGVVTWQYGDENGANGWTFWMSSTLPRSAEPWRMPVLLVP